MNPLGDDLLPLLTLALGAALAFGTALALVKPPETTRKDSDLERAPLGRSLVQIAIGLVATTWALATLFS